MISGIEFTKLHCVGNDFILIDQRNSAVPISLPDLARQMCRRRLSVGADGLLLLEPAKGRLAFSLRYFNPNGSEAQFCGNGSLCASLWVYENGLARNPIKFEWMESEYEAWVEKGEVTAELPHPKNLNLNLPLQSGKVVDYVVIGVPHVVIFESQIDRIDVDRVGREIRNDISLSPEGVNVDFCETVDPQRVKVRTYERGVEGETLSCGSGAAACSYIANLKSIVGRDVEVSTSGGVLRIHIGSEKMFLRGKPLIVYHGIWRGT